MKEAGSQRMSEPQSLRDTKERILHRGERFWKIIKDVENGKVCSEEDFDLKQLAPTLREVLNAHEITRDPGVVVPTDDSLADDVYEAALELCLSVGTCVTDARRRLRHEEDDVKDALNSSPAQLTFGEGPDASVLTTRSIEDERPPFCMFGAGSPVSEDIYFDVLRSYAKEPFANTFSGGIGLNTVSGMTIRAKSPSEVHAAILNAILTRQAAIDVGRPGIGIHNVIGSAESTGAIIAANRPDFGIRPTDGFLVASLPELKVDYERLNKVAHLLSTSNIIGALYGPIMGGYAGPEGTAVLTVANAIQDTLMFQAHYHMPFPLHITDLCNTTPELLWVISVVGQAVSRNTHLLMAIAGELASGPCTDMVLYEASSYAIAGTVSGLNLMAVEVAKNKYLDHCSGMEARMAAEAGHATARSRIKRADANLLLKEILKRYQDRIKDPSLGKGFRECYDLKTITPSLEYDKIHASVAADMKNLGLQI
jgi:methylamine--corrinoid protein Co-methyltransferase